MGRPLFESSGASPSRKLSLEAMSSPSQGSSRTSSLGLAIRALAMATLCLSPCESSETIFPCCSKHPIVPEQRDRPPDVARPDLAPHPCRAELSADDEVDDLLVSPTIESRYELTRPVSVLSSRRSASPNLLPRTETVPLEGHLYPLMMLRRLVFPRRSGRSPPSSRQASPPVDVARAPSCRRGPGSRRRGR